MENGRVPGIDGLPYKAFWAVIGQDVLDVLYGTVYGEDLLVDFFWDGLHWIPQSVLHLPKEEGGQGLVQLASRTAAFRLQFLQTPHWSQRLNMETSSPWTFTQGRRTGARPNFVFNGYQNAGRFWITGFLPWTF
ncbi:hypothetical protein QTP70_020808 [Hemibagrus guttatus]|uniref:Uncharacterized protein n=1 Tax=Hemibagrus guttatus TaxID=175788 RepID=A0AAE0RG99_9TELE|nr:hypothetical protein QTP70_020808 [Hemibagrus guttatus]